MAQYTEIFAGNSLEITNNINTFRYDVRAGDLYLDQEITVLGFSGVEGVDWDSIEIHSGGGVGRFRVGARSLHWVVDETLDATGFAGAEDVNWVNITKNKLS